MKIGLIGTGYVGQAFLRYFRARPEHEVRIATREDTRNSIRFAAFIDRHKPDVVINAGGMSGADDCELNPGGCYLDNLVMPVVVAAACRHMGVKFGHVSTGCLYNDPIEVPREADPYWFDFLHGSSIYSGTKALAEEMLRGAYIWRIRMPFDGTPHRNNLLVKLAQYPKLVATEESITSLDDFPAWAMKSFDCLPDTWHMVNGSIRITTIAEMLLEAVLRKAPVATFSNEVEYHHQIQAPRSSCTLDNSKLRQLVGDLCPIEDVVHDSISKLSSHMAAAREL